MVSNVLLLFVKVVADGGVVFVKVVCNGGVCLSSGCLLEGSLCWAVFVKIVMDGCSLPRWSMMEVWSLSRWSLMG